MLTKFFVYVFFSPINLLSLVILELLKLVKYVLESGC